LLTGPLEPTNEWYAVAKIAGIKLAQAYRQQYGCDFISAQPTNLYGTGDNFDLKQSHVIPALIRKAHAAKVAGDATMPIWGSGTPRREFLHVDDLADALVFLVRNYSDGAIVNVGSGEEVTIRALAEAVNRVVGFEGDLAFDASKPDGVMRKLVDVTRIHGLGWHHRIGLEEGLTSTYRWFLDHHDDARGLDG
jgi:GDP-L-fucose synthase